MQTDNTTGQDARTSILTGRQSDRAPDSCSRLDVLPAPPGFTFTEWVLLALLLLLALALRLPGIGRSLWHDELLTLLMHSRQSLWHCVAWYPYPNNHILHSVILYFFARVADHEIAFRLPALLGGLGAVAAVYFIAREAFNPRAAWLSGGLTAIAVYHVAYSQHARGYTLQTFFAALQLWFAWKWLRPGAPWWWRELSAVAAILCLWCIPSSALFLAGFLAGLGIYQVWSGLASRRCDWRRLGSILLWCAEVLLITLLLYAPVLEAVRAEGGAVQPVFNPVVLARSFYRYNQSILAELYPFLPPTALFILLLCCAGWLGWRFRRQPATVSLICGGAFLSLLAGIVLGKIGFIRILIFLVVPFALLLGGALEDFLSWIDARWVKNARWVHACCVALPLLALAGSAPALREYYAAPNSKASSKPNEEWKEAILAFRAQLRDDLIPVIVLAPGVDVQFPAAYYLRRLFGPREQARDAERLAGWIGDLKQGKTRELQLLVLSLLSVWEPGLENSERLQMLERLGTVEEKTVLREFPCARIYRYRIALAQPLGRPVYSLGQHLPQLRWNVRLNENQAPPQVSVTDGAAGALPALKIHSEGPCLALLSAPPQQSPLPAAGVFLLEVEYSRDAPLYSAEGYIEAGATDDYFPQILEAGAAVKYAMIRPLLRSGRGQSAAVVQIRLAENRSLLIGAAPDAAEFTPEIFFAAPRTEQYHGFSAKIRALDVY